MAVETIENVMKPQIKETILKLEVGQRAVFLVPTFKPASARNAVYALKTERPELVFDCTEKNLRDGIEVIRIK